MKVGTNIQKKVYKLRNEAKFPLFLSNQSDIDECSADPSPCNENAECTNSDGSYSCTCKQGFDGDGTACEGKGEYII